MTASEIRIVSEKVVSKPKKAEKEGVFGLHHNWQALSKPLKTSKGGKGRNTQLEFFVQKCDSTFLNKKKKYILVNEHTCSSDLMASSAASESAILIKASAFN